MNAANLSTFDTAKSTLIDRAIRFGPPYRVGDSVAIVGVEGRVDAVSMFSTVLSHADLSHVVAPPQGRRRNPA